MYCLTFPTYCGSDPMYSSSTKNWFQTHPLFTRWTPGLPCLLSLALPLGDVISACDVAPLVPTPPLIGVTSPSDVTSPIVLTPPLWRSLPILLWGRACRGLWVLCSSRKQETTSSNEMQSLVIIGEGRCRESATASGRLTNWLYFQDSDRHASKDDLSLEGSVKESI